MSVQATLKDERAFDRETLVLIGGGLAAGLAASALQLIVGESVQALSALSFGAIIGLFANLLDSREETATLRVILGVIGGALMAGLGFLPLVAAFAGGSFIGAAMSLGREGALPRRLAVWAGYGVALAAAVFTTNSLITMADAPIAALDVPLVGDAVIGSLWGLFLAVPAGLKDFRWRRDPHLAHLEEARAVSEDTIHEYLDSARELYEKVVDECDKTDHDGVRERALQIAEDTVDSMARFAHRLRELQDARSTDGEERLRARASRLERRIQGTDDPGMRRELEGMREQVTEQIRMRERLGLACMRLESHHQKCLTTLERLHVTLVQNSTAPADDVGLHESLPDLEHLADEVQLKNLAVEELCEVDAPESDGEAVVEPREDRRDMDGSTGSVNPHGYDGSLDVDASEPDLVSKDVTGNGDNEKVELGLGADGTTEEAEDVDVEEPETQAAVHESR